jgi:hypothetical protein
MPYRALSPAEAQSFVSRTALRADEIPEYGLIVSDGRITVLAFRKTTGELILVDVTERIPGQFEQKYPAPPGFWDEVMRRVSGAPEWPGDILQWVGETVGRGVRGIGEGAGGAGLWVLAGIALALWIFRPTAR